jgi:hypothetical protein
VWLLSKGGDVDMSGEKHGIEAGTPAPASAPAAAAAASAASAPEAASAASK